LSSWFRRLASWIFTPKLALVTLAGLLFVLGWLTLSKPTEAQIRVVGMILQLMGFVTIIIGISGTRKLFGLPTFTSSLLHWLRAFPKRHLPPVSASAVIDLGPVTMTGHATVHARFSEKPTLELRVQVLEQVVASLREASGHLKDQLQGVQQTAGDAVSKERLNREAEDASIRARLMLSQTGGLNLSFMGVVWLLVGVIMTSVPYEIEALFHS